MESISKRRRGKAAAEPSSNGQAQSTPGGRTWKNRRLGEAAIAILDAEQPITLRGLLYRLVSSGELPSTDKREYARLGRLMTSMREQGTVPRTWIVDHLRDSLKPSSWSGLADFSETVRDAYRKDLWARQSEHVAVFVEKDATAATMQPVTHEFDVNLHVCRGYSSVSFAGEIADEWARIEKPIYAYYCGDFDPSGFDIERDLREKLERYSGRSVYVDVDDDCLAMLFGMHDSNCVMWKRLGVDEYDFAAYDLIRLAVKTTDRRAAAFVEEHGEDCAELDALPPTELRRRVREAIERHIDADEWKRLRTVEEQEKESLQRFTAAWGKESA